MRSAFFVTRVPRFLLLCVALAAGTGAAQSAEEMLVIRAVHGFRIALAVHPDFGSAPPGADPKHAERLEHLLVVSVRDEATNRPVEISAAALDVAELGYKGTTMPLTPIGSGEATTYQGRVRLKTKSGYRILVHAAPAGGGRTLEAQFEYRHHH